MSMTMQRDYDPKRGRWIPWVFVGGMGLVVAVNALLVWFALSTFTGVTVPRAYERGRGYDQVLTEAARQDALGWRGDITLEAGMLRLAMQDAAQQPLHGRVEGVMLRPLEGVEVPLGFAATGHSAPGNGKRGLRFSMKPERLLICASVSSCHDRPPAPLDC
jgi:nitrogen fixation protein FixH